jgi:hypothetical protein
MKYVCLFAVFVLAIGLAPSAWAQRPAGSKVDGTVYVAPRFGNLRPVVLVNITRSVTRAK